MLRALVYLVIVLAALGCEVYDPSLVEQDAGPTSSCDDSRVPPPRPPGEDDGADIGEVVYGIRDVVFNQGGDRWQSIGFNLDGRCSKGPDWDVECRPPGRTASPEPDGEGGIDNSFGHNVFPVVEYTVPGLEETARDYQERGVGGIVISVRKWNGEPNDSQIEVIAAITTFATTGSPSDTEPPEVIRTPSGPRTPSGEPLPPPAWDGNDWFWLRSDNFVGGNIEVPYLDDDNAYVADGMMVIRLPEGTDFVFPGEEIGVLVRLTDAVATARISSDRSTLEDITVAGRWSVVDLLRTAETVGVCTDSREYEILQNLLEGTADVRADARPAATCDAVSLGLAFERGVRVRIGGLSPGDPVPDSCDPTRIMDGGTATDGGAGDDGGAQADGGV